VNHADHALALEGHEAQEKDHEKDHGHYHVQNYVYAPSHDQTHAHFPSQPAAFADLEALYRQPSSAAYVAAVQPDAHGDEARSAR
jgi:hypothetical protein